MLSPWPNDHGKEQGPDEVLPAFTTGASAMDQNLMTRCLVNQAERTILLARLERVQFAQQAAASRPKRANNHAIRGWIGAVLIATGERMRTTPAPARINLETTLAD
jgi:hypothetical protein